MRSDLNKVMCEHERSGSYKSFAHHRHAHGQSLRARDWESLPYRESITRRYHHYGDNKDFGENTRALYGEVRAYLGKTWNQLYSDLCRNFNMSVPINRHILQHLDHYLEKDVVFEDGELKVRHYDDSRSPVAGSSIEFYVDPRDGVIRRNTERYSARRAKLDRKARAEETMHATFRKVDVNHVLYKCGQIWFQFTLEDIPPPQVEYVRPHTKDLFVSSSRPLIMKPWKELNEKERKIHGVRTLVGGVAYDEYLQEKVWLSRADKPYYARNSAYGSGRISYAPHGRYHTHKRTAPRKLLKATGVI